MKARVKLAEAMRFIGGSGSGHEVIMFASATSGEETKLRPSPMEMLPRGIGDCRVYSVVKILQRMRLPVEDMVVKSEAVRADKPPKVFTKIDGSFTVTGGVTLKKAETVEIAHEIEVIVGNAKPCLPISPSA